MTSSGNTGLGSGDASSAGVRTMGAASGLSLIGSGLAIALSTAAAHLAIVAVAQWSSPDMYWPWSGRDVSWMVPLAYLTLFTPLILTLVAVHALVPRYIPWYSGAGVYVALGAFALLLLYPRLHFWALALLAVGAGVQFASLYRARRAVVDRVLQRAGLGLAVLFLVGGGGPALLRGWGERQALARVATRSDAPNVILLILDTVRASSLGLYGGARPTTPRLMQWAGRGVTFTQAYATAPWTLPSHASLFTGRYASQQSGDWLSRLDDSHSTLAEVFRDRGYATGGFVGNLVATGFETGLARGFMRYEDARFSWRELLANTTIGQADAVLAALDRLEEGWVGGAMRALAGLDFAPANWTVVHAFKSAPEVIEPFLKWQGSLEGRPFFAFLNLFDAHNPERTPAPYRAMFNGGAKRIDMYDGSLRYLDAQISDLLDELERRGTLRNTIVIITADHGEQFGEHGVYEHGNSLYREVLRVPLLILGADSTAAGRRVVRPVSLRDVPATILDLAKHPGPFPLPGRSLAPHWRGESATTSSVVAEVSRGVRDNPRYPTHRGDMAAALDDSLYLIRNGDGELEAYAYRSDTLERRSLAVGAAEPALRAHFDSLYARALRAVRD